MIFESLAVKVSVLRLVLPPTVVAKILLYPVSRAFLVAFSGIEYLRSSVTHFFWEWQSAQTYSVVWGIPLNLSAQLAFVNLEQEGKENQVIGLLLSVRHCVYILSSLILMTTLGGRWYIPILQTEAKSNETCLRAQLIDSRVGILNPALSGFKAQAFPHCFVVSLLGSLVGWGAVKVGCLLNSKLYPL